MEGHIERGEADYNSRVVVTLPFKLRARVDLRSLRHHMKMAGKLDILILLISILLSVCLSGIKCPHFYAENINSKTNILSFKKAWNSTKWRKKKTYFSQFLSVQFNLDWVQYKILRYHFGIENHEIKAK